MSLLHLSRLRETQKRLRQQSNTIYTTSAQQELRQMLAATIKTLHNLYPDGLAAPQRYQLLQNLMMLEQQFLQLAPAAPQALHPTIPLPSVSTWKALHQSLLAAIDTTLADVGASRQP